MVLRELTSLMIIPSTRSNTSPGWQTTIDRHLKAWTHNAPLFAQRHHETGGGHENHDHFHVGRRLLAIIAPTGWNAQLVLIQPSDLPANQSIYVARHAWLCSLCCRIPLVDFILCRGSGACLLFLGLVSPMVDLPFLPIELLLISAIKIAVADCCWLDRSTLWAADRLLVVDQSPQWLLIPPP